MNVNVNLPASADQANMQPVSYQPHGYGYNHVQSAEFLEQESRFSPLKLLGYILKYRWAVASLLICGLFIGMLFTWLQTPLYRGQAKMEIVSNSSRILQELDVFSEGNDLRKFQTAREKLLSRDLARRVAFELNLSEKLDFLAPVASFSLKNVVRRAFGQGASVDVSKLGPEERENLAINIVQEGMSASLIPNTSIIVIGFVHPVPQFVKAVPNEVVSSYINQSADKKSESSDLTRKFIQEQVKETKKDLESAERKLVEYAEQENLTLTGDNASLISVNLAEVNKQLAEAEQERLKLEAYVEQVKQTGSASLPQVYESEGIRAAKEKIVDLRAEYQQKLATLKPGFPEMRKIRAQISSLQGDVNRQTAAIGQGVGIQYRQAVEKEKKLKERLAGLKVQETEFQKKNIRYTILKRDADSARAQYESLIKKLSDVGVGSDLKQASAGVVEEARVPGVPFSPNLLKALLFALLLASAVAAAFIYVMELVNNTFAVPDQIEAELNIPVLGVLPKTESDKIAEELSNIRSSLSEAHRTLRTSLQFTGTDGDLRNILVTSAEPSEGKTTVATRLASDFAALGKNVLLVDADLRKPRMHREIGVDNVVGLSNLLTNVVSKEQMATIFKPTKYPNLTVLTAGTIPPNPADLLASARAAMIFDHLSNYYDMVVIDSPPVMGLADAPLIGRMAQATLLVISCKQVGRKSAHSALQRLKTAGANVVGAAFTKFEVSSLDYNYSYRYMKDSYHYYGADLPALTSTQDEQNADGIANSTIGADQNAGKSDFAGNLFNTVSSRLSKLRK